MDERDQRLLGIARKQHGVWTLAQAIDCKFTRPAIRRRVEQARWEELQPRVYRLFAPAPPEFRQALMALVLATDGVAARASAAALHGWVRPPDGPAVAIRRTARRNSHSGVAITDTLEPPDLCTVDGIPTTSVVRTLIDLAGFMPRDQFEDLFDSVVAGGGVRLRRLETRARELSAPRRSGCAVVLRLVAETSRDAVRARNGWEAGVLRTIGRLGLPPPKVNHRVRVGGKTRFIDLAWPDERVAVELDGFVAHLPRRVFDDDRDRQNDLVDAKWKVYRITWTAFRRDPRHAFRQVAAALGVQVRVIRNGKRSR